MKHLIVYTTKYGSVRKAVEMLEQNLKEDCTVVDIRRDELPEIADYDTISIGGSVYMGKLQKEIKNFMSDNLETLLTKRIGLFACAGEWKEPQRTKQFESLFPEKLWEHAEAKEIFGDEIYWEKVNLLEKIAMRLIKGVKESRSNLSPEAIERYAKNLETY